MRRSGGINARGNGQLAQLHNKVPPRPSVCRGRVAGSIRGVRVTVLAGLLSGVDSGVRRFCANCDTQAMMTVEPLRGRRLAGSKMHRRPPRDCRVVSASTGGARRAGVSPCQWVVLGTLPWRPDMRAARRCIRSLWAGHTIGARPSHYVSCCRRGERVAAASGRLALCAASASARADAMVQTVVDAQAAARRGGRGLRDLRDQLAALQSTFRYFSLLGGGGCWS